MTFTNRHLPVLPDSPVRRNYADTQDVGTEKGPFAALRRRKRVSPKQHRKSRARFYSHRLSRRLCQNHGLTRPSIFSLSTYTGPCID